MQWWQLEVTANAAVAVAYLAISCFIIIPLARLGELRSNKLGLATAAIFFSCSVGHGLHAIHPFTTGAVLTGDQANQVHPIGDGTWWLAVWHSLTAGVGIYYLSLRRYYGRLLNAPAMYDDLLVKRRLTDLEALEAQMNARAEAEADRDFYASMMRSINQNSPSLIYVKDLEGRYLMVNEAFERSLGIAEAEILGQTDAVIDAELAPQWQDADRRAREGRYQVEEIRDDADGRHYFQSIKFPVFNCEGEMYGTCGVSLDVTELKRINAALAKTRDAALAAAAAKSTFLATMSHEIRTPMNAVIGMTDLLLDTELDEQQQDFVGTIRSSGDALLAVINDILDFSKIESGELTLTPRPFDLREEVESALDLLAAPAAAKRLDLVGFVDDSCPAVVVGDAPRLRQILINLLSNAVKFTPAGDVLLAVKAAPGPDDRLALTFTVTDTGIGISAEGQRRLFTSFSQVDTSSTRSHGGTGLGLAISRRLAQAMDGDISVESVPGEGSTFSATVLLLADPGPGPYPSEPPPTVAGRSALIVDDNATNLRILDLQLGQLGMVTTAAATPQDALTLVAEGQRFDVAVLDLHMPGLDGVELASRLRELPSFAGTPMILLASMGDRPLVDSIFAVSLTKPVKSAALHAALGAALGPVLRADAPGAVPTSSVAAGHGTLRILLAEDNQVNQRVAQLMLDKLGHTVTTVENGAAAVEAFQYGDYDVVLMDVQMPRLDGLEATRQIRSLLPSERQPYIIAMTASAMLEDQRASALAGMDAHLTKPVRASQLEAQLARVRPQPSQASGTAAPGAAVPTPVPRAIDAAVDPTVLDALRVDLEDHDGSAVDQLIITYLMSAETLLPDLTRALSDGDTAKAASLAHALVAATSLVGARPLAALLQRAQTVAHDELADLPGLAAQINAEAGRVLKSLSPLTSADGAARQTLRTLV